MNPYAILAAGTGTSTSSALAARLAVWHDAMVAHERRLRAARAGDVCDDECPHVEARTLWAEALEAFGERAYELPFLRYRATSVTSPAVKTALTRDLRRQRQARSSSQAHHTKEAEL